MLKLKNKKIAIVSMILVMLFTASIIPITSGYWSSFRKDKYYMSKDSPYNYGEALQKAIYFYMQQRSGKLPEDNPVIWRGDSCLNDGADVGVDLTGGYFDAGDHVKFNLPMASTMATIAWSIYEFEDAFKKMNQLDDALDAIKWGTDYLIKCHTGPNEFYFQVGDGHTDHGWWGPAEVLEKFVDRPSFKADMTNMATTPVAASAAALAFAAIIFEDEQPNYAAECLNHAKQLYEFGSATKNDDYYNEIAGDFYRSWSGFWDELAATGVLLYLNTGELSYLIEAELNLANADIRPERVHDWDNMIYMTQILLAQITEKQIYIDAIESTLDFWLPGGGMSYTPGGLAWAGEWGSLRYSANAAFLASIWTTDELCTSSKSSIYDEFMESQINYILGDNPRNSSYMIGFGDNYPKNPHHRTAHGSWDNSIDYPEKTRHILYGALVGGPGINDEWEDLRRDYQKTEVACDYNSGLIGALAYLTTKYGGRPLSRFPQNYFTPTEERLDEFFTEAKVSGPKIPRGEILHNGDFSDGRNWWSTSETYNQGADAVFTFTEGELAIEMTTAGTDNWHVQLVQGGLTIEQGGEYIISFNAYAAASREIEASIGEEGGDYTTYGGFTVELSTDINTFTHTFTMNELTDENARIQFNMGIDSTNVYICNISVIESKVIDIEQPPTLRVPVLTDIIINGDFSDGFDPWYNSLGWSSAVFSTDVIDGEVVVDIADAGTADWHVLIRQGGLTLKPEIEYTLSFDARAAADRNIGAAIQIDGAWVTGTTFAITTEMTQYTWTFSVSQANENNVDVQFVMGMDNTNLYFDNVELGAAEQILANGDFSDGFDPWYNSLGWSSAVFTTDVIDGEVAVNITDAGTANWHVLIRHGGLTLIPDTEYTLSFDARAAADRIIEPSIQIDGAWVTGTSFALNTEMTRYTWTFSVSQANENNVDLQFTMGIDSTNLYIDNINLGRTVLIENPDYVVPVNLDLESEISVKMVSHAAWPARIVDSLSYRYYVNLVEVYKAGYSVDNVIVQLMESDVPVEISGLIHYSAFTFYVIIDYSGTEIYPGGKSVSAVESVIRIGLPTDQNINPESWDQTNDWSYQGLSEESLPAENIPVYEDGKFLNGNKPPRSRFHISLEAIERLLERFPDKRIEIIDWIIKFEQRFTCWMF
ncbi:MAG: glycoside hydrolase family 9 protein [Candidatus Lokiarchaeota archaeon]|nr:glycoside hydrolase family 9 protein [Candidatus Lokiarchaeota archaeon]